MRRFPEAGVPTLGVCLGHQSLAQAFGGTVIRHLPVHGKTTTIEHDGRTIFAGLPSPLTVGRYHSLVVDEDVPDCFEVSASGGGVVMAIRHRELPAEGVQFHPESVLTDDGQAAAGELPGLVSPRLMPADTLTRAIDALASGRDLAQEEAAAVLAEIMAGNASEVQIAGFLIALRTKGETVDELAGLAGTMRALADAGAVRARRPRRHRGHRRRAPDVQRLDDRRAHRRRRRLRAGQARQPLGHRACRAAPTSSRRSARASTSRPTPCARCIDEAGFGFMFAPAHHQATRFVVPVRKELAVRTIFNFLGPLTNPAGARRQLIGVSDPAFLERMAGALARWGSTVRW